MKASTLTISATKTRIQSIDLLRGVIMLIMALDHVRDYFHADAFMYGPTNLEKTSISIFFTRWITHFCAPIFMFLAGTSAFLIATKKTKKQLSFFLFTRGLWLIFLELTVISFAWYFNFHFYFTGLAVIWALGISMIILSLLIYLPKPIILVIGLILIFGHNILDNFHIQDNSIGSIVWAIVHEPHNFIFQQFSLFILYPIIPWVGVMAAGYCFGQLYTNKYNVEKRKKLLIYIGLGCIAVFIILRYSNIYGDVKLWSPQKNIIFTLLSFINTSKYPPSLLYLLMTLGPAMLFLAFTEKPLNKFQQKISIYGRVPMFYYLIHLYLIHLLAMIAAIFSGYKWSDMVLTTWATNSSALKGYGFNLLTVYCVWIIVILILYPLCKWYDRYKTNNKQKWWLSYI